MSDFQPLEDVDRGSETQSQLVENLSKLKLFSYNGAKICLSFSTLY